MKQLKQFEFPVFGARTDSHYDWDKWLDGGIYQLEQGEGKDFQCKAVTIIALARSHAKKLGMKLKGTKVEGGVVLQAIPGDDAPSEPAPVPETQKGKKGKDKGKANKHGPDIAQE